MERYTPQERGIIVSIFLTNNRSVVLAQRAFRRQFPNRFAPTGKTFRRLAARLEQTGTTRDLARRGRHRTGRSAENIALVAADVAENEETSTRRRATQLGINRRTLQRILVEDLHMLPYKMQTVLSKKRAEPVSDDEAVTPANGRRRPTKAKGRGRPKKQLPASDADQGDAMDDDGQSSDYKPSSAEKAGRKPKTPKKSSKKTMMSDDHEDNDDPPLVANLPRGHGKKAVATSVKRPAATTKYISPNL